MLPVGQNFSRGNTDFSINFIPKMNYETLINGYKIVLDTIYSLRHYYERVITFLKEYRPRKTVSLPHLQFVHITQFIKSLWFLGIIDKGRWYFWRLLISTLLKYPRHFAVSLGLSVSGFHFRKVAEDYNKTLLTTRHQSV